MLKVCELSAGYGRTQILDNVSLEIGKGEVVTIIGSNGAGKTTLLRTLSGIVPSRSGTIVFDGRNIERASSADIVGMGLVMVPEARQLFPLMSVKDNLMMGAFHRRARPDAAQRFEEIIEIFPRVNERLSQRAGSLSGGEQQMVAIARGLMSSPRLLMLDEPSLGLAPIIVQEVFNTVDRIAALGTTVLLVEQKAFHALKIAQRAYVIENGRIVMADTGARLLENPDVKKAYLGV